MILEINYLDNHLIHTFQPGLKFFRKNVLPIAATSAAALSSSILCRSRDLSVVSFYDFSRYFFRRRRPGDWDCLCSFYSKSVT